MRSPFLILLAAAALALAATLAACSSEEEVAPQTTASSTPVTGSATPSPTAGATPSTTPAATLTYVDPISGLSFQYPAGWFIDGPPADPTILAYAVTLTSYNPKDAPQVGVAPPLDQLKVDVGVDPNPDKLTVEDWIMRRTAGPAEGVTEISRSAARVGGEPAVVRVVSVDGSNVEEYFFAHNSKMFSIMAYAADSSLIGELDGIVETFKFAP